MISIDEIIAYLSDNGEKSLSEISNHFNINFYDISDKLRQAEISGMVMCKRLNKKEIWSI